MPTTIPTTTSTTRPGSPSTGDAYFETDTKNYIIYDGANWRSFGSNISNRFSAFYDGTDDHFTGTLPTTLMSSDFTTSIWLKVPGSAVADGAIYANNYSASGKLGWRLYFDNQDTFGNGNLSLWVSDGSGNFDNAIANVSINLGSNSWTNLVWGRSSGTHFVYVNASQVTITQGTQGFNSSTSNFADSNQAFKIFEETIGGGPIGGYTDEFAVWDRALSTSEIGQLKKNDKPSDLSSLAPEVWFRFGDANGDQDSGGGSSASGDTIGTLVNLGSVTTNATLTQQNGVQYNSDVPV
jgi:hypothetical protein